MPLLSIIVPVYNVEKYLRLCLNSLINQTLKDIEIIVVNDASPDNSEDIILEYAAQDSRIVYIKHEQNKCLGGARNTGMKAARGQYIAFVDSDDYVDKHLYENAIKAFEKHDVDVVIYSMRRFRERKFLAYSYLKKSYIFDYSHIPSHVTSLKMIAQSNWSGCNKVFRRKDLIENQLFFPEHMYWEDMLFWFQYCLAIHPRQFYLPLDKGKYWYRGRKDSIMANKSNSIQMPLIFDKMYSCLEQSSLTQKDYEDFYFLICKEMEKSYLVLSEELKYQYMLNFNQFLKHVTANPQILTFCPVWDILKRVDKIEYQIMFCDAYISLKTDQWYHIGQLSRAQKIKFLFTLLFRRIIRLFTF